MHLQEKLRSFIMELHTFRISHPIIFGKWLTYISEHCTNYNLAEKLIEGDKLLIVLNSGVCDLSLQDYNRVLLYKLSTV